MREKLIELMTDDLPHCENPLQFTYDEIVERLADHLIANGVTIPVRCKNCRKRYNPKECPMCILVYGEQHDFTQENGYCDRGERSTNETL